MKQIDSMLPCVCSVVDHRGRQNVVRTSVTHSAIASCATFFLLTTFLRHLCSVTWQHGIIVNYTLPNRCSRSL